MVRYSWLTNRTIVVHSTFQNISKQLSSIVVRSRNYARENSNWQDLGIVQADSLSISNEIQRLKEHVLDSVNSKVALQLDTLVHAELPWLTRFSKQDSLNQEEQLSHLATLKRIDSLLTRGLLRTNFLFKYRQERLNNSISEVRWRIVAFLCLAFILLVYSIYKFFHQRSKRLAGEGKLKQQEYVFQTLVENNGEIIVLLDERLNYIYRSASAERITGHAKSGSHVKTDEIHPEDRGKVRGFLEEIIPSPNRIIPVSYRVRHREGHYIWLEGTFMNKLTDPEIGAIVVNLRDVTERKNAEFEVEVRERRFRETLDNMMEGAQIIDFNWRYIYVNDALSAYSGYTSEQLIGHTIQERYPGVEQTELFRVLKRCMEEKVPEHLENEFVFPNGNKRFFELSVQPVPEGIFILSVDITDRKKVEQENQKLNRLYAFISSINQSIVHIRDEANLLKQACEIATKIGKFKVAWIDMLDEQQELQLACIDGEGSMRSSLESGPIDYNDMRLRHTPVGRAYHSGEYAVCNDLLNDPLLVSLRESFSAHDVRSAISLPIRKWGKMVGVFNLSSSQPDFFDKHEVNLLLEAAGDISFALEIFERNAQHQVMENLVIHNEKRFRALIEKSTDMKTLTDLSAHLVYASPSVFTTFDYEEDDLLYKSVLDLLHPEERPLTKELVASLLEKPGTSIQLQFRLKHKKGHWVWCEGTLTNMLHEPAINALVANFTDISKRKAAEEQKELAVQEREKMLSDLMLRSKNLEQFAYMVSHNLRSPVAQILGISNILKGNLSKEERVKSQDFMYRAVEKLDSVVKDLNKILEVRGSVTENKEECHLTGILEDIKIGIRDSLEREQVQIENDFEVDCVQAIRSYVYSIFYNLITNSVKYRSADRKLIIRIRSYRRDGKIILEFKDNGTGIDLEKYGSKVFGLYNRFHENIAGKGIGLFMVKAQVEALEGKIEIKSAVGEGTEFRVELPDSSKAL